MFAIINYCQWKLVDKCIIVRKRSPRWNQIDSHRSRSFWLYANLRKLLIRFDLVLTLNNLTKAGCSFVSNGRRQFGAAGKCKTAEMVKICIHVHVVGDHGFNLFSQCGWLWDNNTLRGVFGCVREILEFLRAMASQRR